MKKYIIISLLLFIPSLAMAADHCTNPKEYTVDKRCYVTDAQKKEKPYNAVVALVYRDSSLPYCTGTIVKDKDGKPYLYTAKHCTGDENDLVLSELHIKLQDGRKLKVTKKDTGIYNIKHDVFFKGDWAIYQLGTSNVPSVEITDKKSIGLGPFTYDHDARVVGYGSLKIMSDREISDFKQKYTKYLKDKNKNLNIITGLLGDGINTENSYFINFIQKSEELKYFVDNRALKVSNCKYSSNGKLTNCQAWGGNSGGPIFDSKNAIMGILTRGLYIIGGPHHVGSDDYWFEPIPYSIPLLKPIIKINEK